MIENSYTKIKFFIFNNGNSSFNGRLVYVIGSKDIQWDEAINITIKPHDSIYYTTTIQPVYPGPYWVKTSIENTTGLQVDSNEHPFKVHSYAETAAIAGVLIAIIIFFARNRNS